MNTRNLLAVAAGALVLTGAAMAQTTPNARPNAGPNARPNAGPNARPNAGPNARPRAGMQNRFQERHPLMAMLAQLNLTDAQKQQVRGFFQTAQAESQKIREDTSLTPEQRREKMQAVMQALQGKVMGILTEEQKKKLAELRRRGPGRGGFMDVLEQLNLTDAQKADVQKILQEQREKARIIRESNLSDADKRQKQQALAQETRQRILALLTPEQRQKLEQLRPGPGGPNGRPDRPNRPNRGPRPGGQPGGQPGGRA